VKKLTATIPGFGIKRELAPEIVQHFGQHELYYEPFCFSCAVLLAKPQCRNEVASDRNPDVINLLRCLTNDNKAKQLWEFVSTAPLSETLFEEAAERLKDPFSEKFTMWSRAADFLLVSWQGPSGIAGTTRKPRFAVRNTTSGGSLAARWRGVAPAIPEWHTRLCNVEFRNCNAFEIIEDIPDRDGVLVYCDPPYTDDSRTGGRYLFDFTPEDHVRLRDALARFQKSRVVVSYRDCPTVNDLYREWRTVTLRASRKLKNVVGGEQEDVGADEILLINQGE